MIFWSISTILAEVALTMFAPQHMNPEDLDETKAFDLLCGSEQDRQRACSFYYLRHSELILNCVRAKYRSLPSDLAVDAVHNAFSEFFETATTNDDFDPETPQRLILKIALRRACDLFRRHTHHGKYKEESLDEIAEAMGGTDTSETWAKAVSNMRAREIQELFHDALERFGDRQRKIARIMVDRLDGPVTDKQLAELYRETYNESITVPAAKRAREEVRKKFYEILKRNAEDHP